MFLASITASNVQGKLVPNYHVCTHAIRIWDAYTGAELFSLEGHEEGVLEACFSPCGKYVASTSMDGTVRLWKISDGAAQTITTRSSLARSSGIVSRWAYAFRPT